MAVLTPQGTFPTHTFLRDTVTPGLVLPDPRLSLAGGRLRAQGVRVRVWSL